MSSDIGDGELSTADKIAEQLDADVLLFSGGIYSGSGEQLLSKVPFPRRKNILLVLATYGGSGDAAYRMAHRLQVSYSHGEFIVFVPTVCKSAGTLIAVGAHQLIMSDHAELGPLDVQVVKHDEVGERSSGLTPSQTLNTLRNEACNMFENVFNKLRGEQFRFPTRMAAGIASEMSIGLLRPLYEQIDPMRLGEIERAMMVAAEYGERIKTGNVKQDSLESLLTSYPSHSFVIDREEAGRLFHRIRSPTSDEYQLIVDEISTLYSWQFGQSTTDTPTIKLLSSIKRPSAADQPREGQSNEQNPTNNQPTQENSGLQGDQINGAPQQE